MTQSRRILIMVLVGVIVAGGGYMFLKKKNAEPTYSDTPATASPSATGAGTANATGAGAAGAGATGAGAAGAGATGAGAGALGASAAGAGALGSAVAGPTSSIVSANQSYSGNNYEAMRTASRTGNIASKNNIQLKVNVSLFPSAGGFAKKTAVQRAYRKSVITASMVITVTDTTQWSSANAKTRKLAVTNWLKLLGKIYGHAGRSVVVATSDGTILAYGEQMAGGKARITLKKVAAASALGAAPTAATPGAGAAGAGTAGAGAATPGVIGSTSN